MMEIKQNKIIMIIIIIAIIAAFMMASKKIKEGYWGGYSYNYYPWYTYPYRRWNRGFWPTHRYRKGHRYGRYYW